MRNSSARFISRFKFAIGAAVVAVAALAMVAVLASTLGVISSQSGTPPMLTFDSSSHGTFNDVPEGEIFTITYTSSSSAGYTLTLDLDMVITPLAGFDFAEDIEGDSFKVTQDGGGGMMTTVTMLPQTVSIESGTTMITITFKAANDELVEPNDSFTLSATPGSGARKTTTITLVDPILTVNFDPATVADINEGGTSSIAINLDPPVTQYLKDQAARASEANGGYSRTVAKGSNFEDISPLGLGIGTAFPFDDNNEQYDRILGFEFEFYGKKHSDIAVHTNGFIGFTDNAKGNVLENVDTSPPGTNQGDKTPGTGSFKLPIVAPLLSPLAYHISDSHGMGITPRPIFYEARLETGTINDRYIVQYTNARALVPGIPDRVEVTFQVALFANGRIEFRYEDIPSTAQGVSKIGISNGTGTGKFNEFSYRTNNFSGGAESDIRIVYTPPLKVEAVTIDSDGNQVSSSGDIIDTIAVGGSSGMVETTHDDNNNWDGDQVYTVEITHNSAAVMTGAAVRYTVMDNDDPVVTLQRVSGNGPIEEGTSVELRARLTNAPGGAPEDLIVRLSTASVTTLELSEYTFPGEVTIPQNGQYVDFTVMITDDTELELNENLTIEVGDLVHSGGTVNKLPTPEKIDLTIPVNDTIAVTGFTASDTNEGDVVTVRVSLNRVLPANTAANAVRLVLDGTDRTNDVTGSQWDITSDLKAGTSAEVMIRLVDDRILEGTERVTLRLMVDSALDDFFPAGARGGSRSFDIIDNESGEVGITPVSNTRPEDGDMVEFEVSLPDGVEAASAVTVSFEIITPPGVSVEIIDPLGLVTTVSASGLGTGFAQGLALPVRGFAQVARTYSITIPAGQTSVRLTIQLTHDGSTEVREQLMVRLLNASTGSANPSVVVGSNAGLANITLSNLNEADFGGILPATGGPVLPVWLLLVLLLTGIALPLTALKLNR